MTTIDGNYISEHMTDSQPEINDFGSWSMDLGDEYSTRIFKISKGDADMAEEWHNLTESISENEHYAAWRIPGGITLGVMSSAQISEDRNELAKAILSEDAIKLNTAGVPNHRCPNCGKPGKGKILGAVKTNAKGKPGKQHLVCDRCGARYKI